MHAIELSVDDAVRLQRFFDANPAYFLDVQGEPAGPDQAREELREMPPPGMAYSSLRQVAFVDASGHMAAFADIVTDLVAEGVCHIGLFIVETARHGNGDARRLYAGIEQWARDHGALWMRLGVVTTNLRAARFWSGRGFVPVRLRDSRVSARHANVVRVMVKPLADRTLDDYLALVARDRPD